MSNTPNLETIVSLCKRRGFIFPGSEVYGGLSGTWDYGPLGLQLKKNIMNLWWKMFVDDREDMFGVDAAILMNPKVWQASGHTETFTDPLVECLRCKTKQRVDNIIDKNKYNEMLNYFETRLRKDVEEQQSKVELLGKTIDYLGELAKEDRVYKKLLEDHQKFSKNVDVILEIGRRIDLAKKYIGPVTNIFLDDYTACPICGSHTWSEPGLFNMMFETNMGLGFSRIIDNVQYDTGMPQPILPSFGSQVRERVYDTESISYLRPETAQGIFTNYSNVVDSFYPEIPFGIAQTGKAFRNEISPRDFIFRSREFEQMEIEYFVNKDNWKEEFDKWVILIEDWCRALGLEPGKNVHQLPVEEKDRAHYSEKTIDFEFDFPIGREELLGLAYRTDFDLQNIQKASGKNMDYRPKDGSPAYVPHVIEPSFGVERAIMAVLTAAYTEDEVNGEKRAFLKLPVHLAPVKVAVSPLLKNKPELVAKAREVYSMLKKEFGAVMWDDNGNIGKRYRRQDEIGTPYCVVIDFETLEGDTVDTVTIRNRDTTEQHRVKISDLVDSIKF